MRKHSVAISKRTYAPFGHLCCTWEYLFKNIRALLNQWVNLNGKMKLHTFSTEPETTLEWKTQSKN